MGVRIKGKDLGSILRSCIFIFFLTLYTEIQCLQPAYEYHTPHGQHQEISFDPDQRIQARRSPWALRGYPHWITRQSWAPSILGLRFASHTPHISTDVLAHLPFSSFFYLFVLLFFIIITI